MTSALAFTFIHEDLTLTVLDWPRDMCLALCLEDTGGHAILLYHQDEADEIGPRIETALGRDRSMIAIAPTIAGFPIPKIRFADERRLHEFIKPDIAEDARNYAMNMRYAIEEELDIDKFMATLRAPIGNLGADRAPGPDMSRMPASECPEDETGNASERDAPLGYLALDAEDCRSCEATTARIRLLPSGEVAIIPKFGTTNDIRMPFDRIFVREDLGALALDVAQMFHGFERRILINKNMIPAPILRDLEGGALPARLARAANFIHVHIEPRGPAALTNNFRSLQAFGPEVPAKNQVSTPAPATAAAAKATRSKLKVRPFQVFLACLIAILMLSVIGITDRELNAAVTTAANAPDLNEEPPAARLVWALTGRSARIDPASAFQ